MSSKFYWIKLKKDFFKRHDIRILESYGSDYVLLYLKMLAESIDHNGKLRFSESVAYTPEMLSAIFQAQIDTIKNALKLLSDLGLIEIEPDGTIRVTRFDNFVGSETEAAIKKRNQRNLPVLKNGSKRLNGSAVITPDGVTHVIDEKRYGGHGMQALDRAFGKCELCGSSENVVVHHNNGYSTELDDLVCLCVSCHGKAHTNANNGHIEIKRPPYVPRLSTESTPLVCQMSTQNIDIRDKSIEKEIDIDKQISMLPPVISEEENRKILFAQFWEAYPKCKRKVDRAGCEKKFIKIPDLENIFPVIMASLESWKQEWSKKNYEYVPMPAKWIHQQYWTVTDMRTEREQIVDNTLRNSMAEFLGGGGE